ncbi:MAG: SixA phosphatase family protein [Longimicrobiales bacterium]
MKTFYLLRHAKSSWSDESLDDFERPLAPRGAKAAPRVATYMKAEGWIPDVVLCSAARRAVETLELISPVLGLDSSARIDRDLYLAEPEIMLQRLRGLPDTAASVLMIGHNPGAETVARRLCGDGRQKAVRRLHKKYPTAALAVLTFPTDSWAQITEGSGHLEAFVRPKDL